MLNCLKEESNMTFTENGALTYKSTESACLDLFASIGAVRRKPESEIIDYFIKAFAEDMDRGHGYSNENTVFRTGRTRRLRRAQSF